MKPTLLLLIALIITSCGKKKVLNVEAHPYFPTNVGSYWTYEDISGVQSKVRVLDQYSEIEIGRAPSSDYFDTRHEKVETVIFPRLENGYVLRNFDESGRPLFPEKIAMGHFHYSTHSYQGTSSSHNLTVVFMDSSLFINNTLFHNVIGVQYNYVVFYSTIDRIEYYAKDVGLIYRKSIYWDALPTFDTTEIKLVEHYIAP